jgi:hypothetical protein
MNAGDVTDTLDLALQASGCDQDPVRTPGSARMINMRAHFMC